MSKLNDKEKLKDVVSKCICFKDVLLAFGLEPRGSNFNTLKKYLSIYDIDTTHFAPNAKRAIALRESSAAMEIPLEEILEGKHPQYGTHRLKQRLLLEGIMTPVCAKCGQTNEWCGEPLAMHLDHINGVSNDHRLDNLRILCPNCHSQTPTYSGKNRTGRRLPQRQTRREYWESFAQSYEQKQQKYVKEILDSDIDFSKHGWVQKVSEIINQRPQRVKVWMQRMMPEFYETKCFKRKPRI